MTHRFSSSSEIVHVIYSLSVMNILGKNVGATTTTNDKVNYAYNVSGVYNQSNGKIS